MNNDNINYFGSVDKKEKEKKKTMKDIFIIKSKPKKTKG
jgi:hypothetical protein